MPKKQTAKTSTATPEADIEKHPTQTETPSATLPKPNIVKSTPAKGLSRKKMWWWIGGSVAVLAIAAFAGWMVLNPGNEQTPTRNTTVETNTNTSTLVPRLLDGAYVQADKTNPNIYAVMIENLTASRPQSGLDKAPVVYEALAEGGISRFMALFPVGTAAAEIGPIRSARLYYVHWAEDYKPLYVHVGGSPQALEYIRTANIVDFNQFFNPRHFWRDRTRSAPHNLYTDSDKLFLGLKQAVPDLVPSYAGWTFKDEDELSKRPSSQPDVVIEYSSFNYRVTYKYHRELNKYFRFQGDSEHVMRDGTKIGTQNAVVMFVKTGLVPGDRQRLQMDVVGEGRVLIFRDGQKFEGTWKKTGTRERLQFFDDQGQPLMLNRGTTWISAVPTDRKVTF